MAISSPPDRGRGTGPVLTIDSYVVDTLLRDLVGHDRRPSAFLVYLSLEAAAADRKVSISHAQLAERTGLSKRAVQDALELLRSRSLIAVERDQRTDVATYTPLRPWRGPGGGRG